MNKRKILLSCLSASIVSCPAFADGGSAGGLDFNQYKTAAATAAEVVTEKNLNSALELVDKLAQKGIEDKTFVGCSVAVVYKDKVILSKGYGKKNVDRPDKVDPDTVFQIASLSKPVGATVVAKLVDEGKISWDSKISDLDPEFQMRDYWVTRQLTIRDLYCHRSGLPDHAGDLLEDLGYDRAEILHRLRYQPPFSSFRTHYAYTNFGITEAAIAASKPYGSAWEDLCKRELYEPLHMNSTSSRYDEFMARSNRADGHVLFEGKWEHGLQRQPDAQTPAGGVSSSANDMAQWLRMLLKDGSYEGKKIISSESLGEIKKPHMLNMMSPLTNLPSFYGLGMGVSWDEFGKFRMSHSGAFAMGAATSFIAMPEEQLGIVVLTNSYPVGAPEALCNAFFDQATSGTTHWDYVPLFRQVFTKVVIAPKEETDISKEPANKTAALANSAYTGKYFDNFFGDVFVVEKDGKLALLLGPKKTEKALEHFDRDVFRYETYGENSSGWSAVKFDVGPKGIAGSLSIESLDVNEPHSFTRVTQ